MSEYGPIYNVELIDVLPCNPGKPNGMLQQMPSRSDLDAIHYRHDRVIAGYEVLLHHWRCQQAEIERLRARLAVFEQAVEHVAEAGTTSRSFSTEGWTMVSAKHYLDLSADAEAAGSSAAEIQTGLDAGQ